MDLVHSLVHLDKRFQSSQETSVKGVIGTHVHTPQEDLLALLTLMDMKLVTFKRHV